MEPGRSPFPWNADIDGWLVDNLRRFGGSLDYTQAAAELSRRYGRPLSPDAVRVHSYGLTRTPSDAGPRDGADYRQAVLDAVRRGMAVDTIANLLDISPRRVREAVDALRNEGYLIEWQDDGEPRLHDAPEPGGYTPIDPSVYYGERVRFGVVADTHLCSRYQRLDVLNALYDAFAQEGIRTVYHAGNWIDGEARFNQHDLLVHGLDRQVRYFAENYPAREGITTEYIAGDDHEGWYTRNTGIDVGRYAEQAAREAGRTDLRYLGYLEHDVVLSNGARVRIAHPGGGSAYALSYQPQKLVESLGGGEKPALYVAGHYHKSGYFYWRNVHVLLAGCTEDQTPWMRKRLLAAHLGGWMVECNLCGSGINRVRTDWLTAYDLGYTQEAWSYRW